MASRSLYTIVAPRLSAHPREVLALAPEELRAALTPKTRQAAALFGRYFRREGDFDYPTFRARDDSYVWAERSRRSLRAVGACGFECDDHVWHLRWIWLHPFVRRHGLLTEAWPWFRLKYGDFQVDPPRSAAMEAFLRKQSSVTL